MMVFAVLLSFGLGLLIATSVARQLPFRGGRIAAVGIAALLASAVASIAGAAPTPALVSALVGAAIGALLVKRD